jgi:Pyruvate phosphate dikinase, AMP/ATP-binding domain
MSGPYTIPLADPRASLGTVGGKGASLARLSRAGLPVPGGFHITTEAYRRFVADNRLQPLILDALRKADAAQPASLETASRRIGALFSGAQIPAEIAAAISTAYAGLQELPVAVRSSATAEDLPEASIAGQQETYLNIRGTAAVLEAVKKCWASLWTGRAIGYRIKNGIAPASVALAVVIQELVPVIPIARNNYLDHAFRSSSIWFRSNNSIPTGRLHARRELVLCHHHDDHARCGGFYYRVYIDQTRSSEEQINPIKFVIIQNPKLNGFGFCLLQNIYHTFTLISIDEQGKNPGRAFPFHVWLLILIL